MKLLSTVTALLLASVAAAQDIKDIKDPTFVSQTPTPKAALTEHAPIKSPFQEDEELKALEKAKEDALLKALEAKRIAVQTAVAPIRVLARGLQGERAVVLLALDANHHVMLAKGDPLQLNTTAGTVEIRLKNVTRQSVSLELSDGTLLPLQ